MRSLLEPSAEAALLPGRPLRRTLQTVAVTAAAVGVGLFLVYDTFPAPWSGVSDSPAVWWLAAWAAGQWVRPPAAVSAALSGAVALWCLLAGFYLGLFVLAGRGEDPARVGMMFVLASVAGVVFGLLGRLRWVRRAAPAFLAAGLLGATFTLETMRYPLTLFLFALQPVPEGVEHILPTAPEVALSTVYVTFGVFIAAVAAPAGRRGHAMSTTLVLTLLGAAVIGVPILVTIGLVG